MGKPSTKGGFYKEVIIRPSVHSQGENLRKTAELMAEASKLQNKGEMITMLMEELKPKIEIILKKVFVKFCQGHNLAEDKTEEEWTHFRKILRRHL